MLEQRVKEETMTKFLTTKEAADYLKLSPRCLEAYRVRGGGPPYIKLGGPRSGRVRYAIEDLEAWLQGLKRISTTAETVPERGEP